MRFAIALLLAGLAACKGAESKLDKAVGSNGLTGEAALVAKDVKAAMQDLANYSEQIFKIMRATDDCDAAAKQLEPLAPKFQELGPRMMKVRERLDSLPQADRDRIKKDSEADVEEMKTRFADADVIEKLAKRCEESSPAFAAIAPSVAFSKKK